MIENIYFMTIIDVFFLIMVIMFLDTIKIITKKNELGIEICKIRFVLATIIIGITVLRVVLEIVDNELPQRTVFGDIFMIFIWIIFCFRENKKLKQQ